MTQKAKYIGDIISYDHFNDYLLGHVESQYLNSNIEEESEEQARISPNTICKQETEYINSSFGTSSPMKTYTM